MIETSIDRIIFSLDVYRNKFIFTLVQFLNSDAKCAINVES